MLPRPKQRKIGFKVSLCILLGYTNHIPAYSFHFLRSDVIQHNIIIETKNVQLFKHVFLLKVDINDDIMCKDLRKNKTNSFFENDFYFYLVENI